jgi:hypothetical protein
MLNYLPGWREACFDEAGPREGTMKLGAALAAGLLAASVSSQAAALTFGIYGSASMSAAEGALKTLAMDGGHDASVLADLSAASLDHVDVLWIMNDAVDAQPAEMTARAADLLSFVQSGGVLLYHDRNIGDAASTLPGAAGVNFVFDDSGDVYNIEVAPGSTLVTDGPKGMIDNSTLDFGNLSSQGYAEAATLPGGSKIILTRTGANEVVDFGYRLGFGFVYYSTISLDYYLAGNGSIPPANFFRQVYAPNLVAYAASRVPEPMTLLLLGGGLLSLGLARRR